MERGVRLTLMQCDSAVVADEKLYVLGGGWSRRTDQPGTFALAGVASLEPHEARRGVQLVLALHDEDGQVVLYQDPVTDQLTSLVAQTDVRVPGERVAGLKAGVAVSLPFVVGFPPMSFDAGKRFGWVVTADGEPVTDWTPSFEVVST